MHACQGAACMSITHIDPWIPCLVIMSLYKLTLTLEYFVFFMKKNFINFLVHYIEVIQ
jgi:hypothetical protein